MNEGQNDSGLVLLTDMVYRLPLSLLSVHWDTGQIFLDSLLNSKLICITLNLIPDLLIFCSV